MSDDGREATVKGEFVLMNEFSEVRVRVVETRNGRGLEVYSPRLGSTNRFDPLALEVLSQISRDDVSQLLHRLYCELPEKVAGRRAGGR